MYHYEGNFQNNLLTIDNNGNARAWGVKKITPRRNFIRGRQIYVHITGDCCWRLFKRLVLMLKSISYKKGLRKSGRPLNLQKFTWFSCKQNESKIVPILL